MTDPIEALAEYLTDNTRVIQNSMRLQSPSRASEAEGFFALRDAFGIKGYDKKDAAVQSITAMMEERFG